MKRDDQEVGQPMDANVTVYKLVAVVDGQRQSATMASRACSAVYVPGQVTYPPIPKSPLFAYRTLEDAQQEYSRLIDVNAWRPLQLATPPMEIWKAVASKEVPGPPRIPNAGTYYVGLLRKCGYGARLSDTYIYFWENTAHCLRYHITKRSGFVLSPSTVFCADLLLLEQMPFSHERDQIPQEN